MSPPVGDVTSNVQLRPYRSGLNSQVTAIAQLDRARRPTRAHATAGEVAVLEVVGRRGCRRARGAATRAHGGCVGDGRTASRPPDGLAPTVRAAPGITDGLSETLRTPNDATEQQNRVTAGAEVVAAPIGMDVRLLQGDRRRRTTIPAPSHGAVPTALCATYCLFFQ